MSLSWPKDIQPDSPTTQGIGWEFVGVYGDRRRSRRRSRRSCRTNERQTPLVFFNAASACDESLGITVERLMTDSRFHSDAFHRPDVRQR